MARRCPSSSEIKPSRMVGIRPFGATGAATGGGVLAFQTDDLAAPFFGFRSGLGAGSRSDLPRHPRLHNERLGSRVRNGIRRGATDAIADDIIHADRQRRVGLVRHSLRLMRRRDFAPVARDHPPRRDPRRGRRLGSRSSGVGGLARGGGGGAIGPNLARIPRKV